MKHPLRCLVVPVLLAVGILPALAQEGPGNATESEQSSTSDGRDKTVQLSPFVVNADKDNGYIATDTVSGSRLSTNLLKTPADVSILTRQLLDDVGAWDLSDALLWLPSSDIAEGTGDTQPDYGNQFTFRGLGGATNTVNNVRRDKSAELYSVERVEQSRGPNSILYGDAVSGGQLNISTKQARFRNFEVVELRTDSEASAQTTVDLNRKLNDKLAVRFNGLLQDRRSYLQGFYDKKISGTINGVYRPFRHTEVRVDGQWTYQDRAVISNLFTDSASSWDGVTYVDAPLTANLPGSTGVGRNTVDKWVLSPAWEGVMNFKNFGFTKGTGLNIVDRGDPLPFPNFPTIDRRSFTIAPPEGNQKVHSGSAAITLVQEIGDLSIEGSATYSPTLRDMNFISIYNNYNVDVNRVLPNGQPNPNVGKIYSESNMFRRYVDQYLENFRVQAAYPLPFFKDKFSQVFSAGWERRRGVFDVTYFEPGRSNNPAKASYRDSSNFLRTFRYWDDPRASQPLPVSGQDGIDWVWGQTRDTRSTSVNDSVQFNTVGTYLKKRLMVVGGVRFDDYDAPGRDAATYDALGNITSFRYSHYTSKARTRSLGATYFITRSIGLYYNYAEGFFPLTTGNPWIGTRGPVGATTSIGRSAGLRFSLLGGKLVGSATYYQSREKDRILSLSPARYNQIWDDLNESDNRIGTGSNYSDTLQYLGKGYEFDFTANLTKHFRAVFNLSFPQTEQAGSRPDTKAYVAEHIAEWEAGANDPNNPNATRIRNNIDSIQGELAGLADGRSLDGTYKYRANIFADYTFQNGAVKGLSINGGANIFGKDIIGNELSGPFDYIYAKAYFVMKAGASYTIKKYKTPITLRLTISNLLDYKDPVYRGVTVYQNATYRNSYFYVEPRNISLTAKFEF